MVDDQDVTDVTDVVLRPHAVICVTCCECTVCSEHGELSHSLKCCRWKDTQPCAPSVPVEVTDLLVTITTFYMLVCDLLFCFRVTVYLLLPWCLSDFSESLRQRWETPHREHVSEPLQCTALWSSSASYNILKSAWRSITLDLVLWAFLFSSTAELSDLYTDGGLSNLLVTSAPFSLS